MPANKPSGDNYDSSTQKSSTVDKFALFCAFVSVASVLGAHAIDRLAENGALSQWGFHRGAAHARVDYNPTASIKNASRVTLDPCVAPIVAPLAAPGENR